MKTIVNFPGRVFLMMTVLVIKRYGNITSAVVDTTGQQLCDKKDYEFMKFDTSLCP